MVEPLLLNERVKLSASLGESHFREFKSAVHGETGKKQPRSTSEICKDIGGTLVAFANADGGELLIGVEDSGEITGVDLVSKDNLAQILKAPKTHVHASTPLLSVGVFQATIDGKIVIHFSIPKSPSAIHLTSDGKCLQRKDLESVPVAPKSIELDRKEARSREYDREYVDGATLANLDAKLIQAIADQISHGMSTEKCLQYLGLADFDDRAGLRLRRAALLLFATNPENFHPRAQVRILKVKGNELGAGSAYNVQSDATVRGSILRLVEQSWDQLRAHLVQTRLGDSARFQVTYMYPENACREALVNAIAHRDYSDEGKGIEIYVFDDRIEIKNPGALLSPMTIEELKEMKGAHQSRNSYISRTLREVGYMRELGEGMRRIFELMKSSELAPPQLDSDGETFALTFYHRPMYSPEEVLWLEQYDNFKLSAEQKAVMLLGKAGLIAPQDIFDRIGIEDTEHYRQLVHSLQTLGLLYSEISKQSVSNRARKEKISQRMIPRFKVRLASEATSKNSKSKHQPDDSVPKPKNASESSIDSRSIFVGNLPPIVTQRDMIMAFEKYGDIANVHIPYSGSTSRGYGFVEFDDIEVAQKILASNEAVHMGGRRLAIRAKKPKFG